MILRSEHYGYSPPIDLFSATPNEVELLNRINAHHAHWAYSRQSFTTLDRLVRVADFLPFFEHLRSKSTRLSFSRPADKQTTALNVSTSQTTKQSRTAGRKKKSKLIETPSLASLTVACEQSLLQLTPQSVLAIHASAPQPRVLVPLAPREPKTRVNRLVRKAQSSKHLPSQQPLSSVALAMETPPSIGSTFSENSEPPFESPTTSKAIPSSSTIMSTVPAFSVPTHTPVSEAMPTSFVHRNLLTQAPQQRSSLVSNPCSSSISTVPSSELHCGWLQINKLYTPYISTSTRHHHLYRIPVSLLTFYDLLKVPPTESNRNEGNDGTSACEQTPATPHEIEVINKLCSKQSIKPFATDTKLINLITFYRYCSVNILFLKELPFTDPKASICKDWSSIVQINGGICRLRNMTTLHEQTVPFIGNTLLKNFIISSQNLSTAVLTTPTPAEEEFLQLILFFSNMSINLRHAKLIDIESARKEYNVDLILLFNDKFPLNVLNYQEQGTPRNFHAVDASLSFLFRHSNIGYARPDASIEYLSGTKHSTT